MTLMREADEAGERVHANPLGRLPLAPGVTDLLDLGLVRGGGTPDQLVAADAGLQRWNARLARHRHGGVAVHAGNLVLAGVDVVTEENRLARTLEVPGIADDRRLKSRLTALGSQGRERESEKQRHHDTG